MKMRYKITLALLAALGLALLFRLLIGGSVVALFMPGGVIASEERSVIVRSVLIMLSAAIPTLALLFTFAWMFRADNPRAAYEPDRTARPWEEVAAWAAPAVIVAVLASIAWTSTHALDPFSPIHATKPALTVQVVALRWKWLFIYPELGIATVNYVEFPEQTPVHFDLTADGPVSSFWIPQLGSQIYAMAAMRTQLNLMASSTGVFPGRNMEINGAGYADMTFDAKSVSRADFDAWAGQVKASSPALDRAAYDELAQPSQAVPPASYVLADKGLFASVLTKDAAPPSGGEMPGMTGSGAQR